METVIRRSVFAASDLGLHCLPMSHKKDAWLILVNKRVLFIVRAGLSYFLSSADFFLSIKEF